MHAASRSTSCSISSLRRADVCVCVGLSLQERHACAGGHGQVPLQHAAAHRVVSGFGCQGLAVRVGLLPCGLLTPVCLSDTRPNPFRHTHSRLTQVCQGLCLCKGDWHGQRVHRVVSVWLLLLAAVPRLQLQDFSPLAPGTPQHAHPHTAVTPINPKGMRFARRRRARWRSRCTKSASCRRSIAAR